MKTRNAVTRIAVSGPLLDKLVFQREEVSWFILRTNLQSGFSVSVQCHVRETENQCSHFKVSSNPEIPSTSAHEISISMKLTYLLSITVDFYVSESISVLQISPFISFFIFQMSGI